MQWSPRLFLTASALCLIAGISSPSGLGCARPGVSSAPTHSASITPVSSAIAHQEHAPPVDPDLPAATRQVLGAFVEPELRTLMGPVSLRGELSALLKSLSGRPTALAFLIDREVPEPLSRSLSWAIAAQRAAHVSFRAALVTWGVSGGLRAEVAFSDSFEVMRAAGRAEWSPESGSMAASWTGLAALPGLAWPGPAEKHVVLLVDDREVGVSAGQPSNRVIEKVMHWARTEQVRLHLWRCQLESEDGDVQSPEVRRPSRGLPLDVLAGLFRSGTWSRTPAESLTEVVASAIKPWIESPGAVDLVLAVDTSGRTGESLSALYKMKSQMQEFLRGDSRRMAVVDWDARKFRIAQPFSSDVEAQMRTLRALPRGPLGDRPKDLFGTIDRLRHRLEWRSDSERAIIIVTSAAARLPVPDALLDWSDRERVSVSLIEVTN
ncbi:MAG TPA: hypothetical protein VFQ61_39705 [Polyangiaceae bacterium]|nr:hypothetical protein [Polyangiaceae bacterium]